MQTDKLVFRFFLANWIIVLGLRQLGLFGTWGSSSFFLFFTIGLWVACFVLGALFIQLGNEKRKRVLGPFAIERFWQNRWVSLLSLVAAMGALLIIYDFSVLRGYGFNTNIAQIRIVEVNRSLAGQAGSSGISGAGRLVVPALQAAWVLACLSIKQLSHSTRAILFFATAVVFYEQALFEGGRNFWATLVVQCFIALHIGGTKIRISTKFKRVFILMAALVGMLTVFVSRVSDRVSALITSYQMQLMHHDVAISPSVAERLNGPLGEINFALAMFWLYITQGFHQLEVLLDQTHLKLAFGAHQFSIGAQGFLALTGFDFTYDNFSNLSNPGTYTTLIGASIIDFGYFGSLFFSASLGAACFAGLKKLQRREFGWLALGSPILATIVLFAPVVSMVPNSWLSFCWIGLASISYRKHRRGFSGSFHHQSKIYRSHSRLPLDAI